VNLKDSTIREALAHLLPKYPAVRSVQVEVDHGVVTLEGQVENEEVLQGVTQFARQVEGVRLVLNIGTSAGRHLAAVDGRAGLDRWPSSGGASSDTTDQACKE
jgi:osmotically-inducible protein OsmY